MSDLTPHKPDAPIEMLADAQQHRHRSIYLLPNAFTTAALFCAFFAIIKAMAADFEVAAILIFFSMTNNKYIFRSSMGCIKYIKRRI